MEAISTSLPEKLPETVRGFLVKTRPLPPGVSFFEHRFTVAALAGRFALGLLLLGVGVLMVPLALVLLFGPHKNVTVADNNNTEWWLLAFSVVLAFAGWTMVSSVPVCLALIRQQKAGGRTRHGLFLTPEALVWRSDSDTTVVPREAFRELEHRTVRYESAAVKKSFTLPEEWIGTAPADVERAVRAWSQPESPPMLPPTPAAPEPETA